MTSPSELHPDPLDALQALVPPEPPAQAAAEGETAPTPAASPVGAIKAFSPGDTSQQSDVVKVALRGEAMKRITAEARRCNAKKGTVLRELALEYLRLRDDHLALGAEGSAVAQMLSDSEARLAATMSQTRTQVDQLDAKLNVLIAAFSTFAKTFLACVPAPTGADREAALAEAPRRYAKLIAGVPGELDGYMPHLVSLVLAEMEKTDRSGPQG